MARPGIADTQLDLLADYWSNVEQYPKYQDYLRTRKPPLLAIWGKNDPTFLPAGAQAFKRDVPQAEVRLLGATSRWKPMSRTSPKPCVPSSTSLGAEVSFPASAFVPFGWRKVLPAV